MGDHSEHTDLWPERETSSLRLRFNLIEFLGYSAREGDQLSECTGHREYSQKETGPGRVRLDFMDVLLLLEGYMQLEGVLVVPVG